MQRLSLTRTPRRGLFALVAVSLLLAGCGDIQVDDGITEVGALSTVGLKDDAEPETDGTPTSKVALDFTTGDEDDDSEAAALRDGRAAPPPDSEVDTTDDDDDDEEEAVGRSEIEDVEEEGEVLIARGTYHADVKEGTALKVRKEPEGKKITSITADVAVKATGEGQTIEKITWAQIRPLGDAEWDIGWVVFDHLTAGTPDVEPTPTLEPTEDADKDDTDDKDDDSNETDSGAETSPPPTATPVPPTEPETPQEESTSEPEEEPTPEPEVPQEDGSSQEITGLGESFVVSTDSELRVDADPSSDVAAGVSAGDDAIIASNTVYRYGGVTYIQVNVGGTLGWIRADHLQ